MELFDFSNCELSRRDLQYGGRAGEKRGIIIDNEFWFLKFPKNTIGMNKTKGLSYVTSPLSEYIGSAIYKILGYNVHETKLGICYDGKRYKVVCACKDFIIDDRNELLIQYTALRNDTNIAIMERNEDNIQSASNLNEIIFQLDNNTILKKLPEAKARFWDVVIIDFLINNNDRNEDNWGVIKYKNNNTFVLAPIFDCGNCFYGKTSEERISFIMQDQDRLISSAVNGITAYEDDNEKRISNKSMLAFKNSTLDESMLKVFKLFTINFKNIKDFINSIPETCDNTFVISKERKEYYIKTMEIRLSMLQEALKVKKYL